MLIQDDVTDLGVDLTELDETVDFLFDETVIQDERLLNLEEEIDVIDNDVDTISNELEGQIYTFDMDVRNENYY